MKKGRLLAFLCVPALCAVATLCALRAALESPLDSTSKSLVSIEVADGKGYEEIAEILVAKNLARNSWSIKLLSYLGRAKPPEAGTYVLTASMTPRDLVSGLGSGSRRLRKFTVVEGESIWNLAPKMAEQGIVTTESIEAALNSGAHAKSLKLVDGTSIEGYLFPGTYEFLPDTPADEIVARMLDRSLVEWSRRFEARAQERGLSRHQVLTIASLIESVTPDAREQLIVSSVLQNRLANNFQLRLETTVMYGIPNFTGVLNRDDYLLPTEYNTFVKTGLPAGPILNPGERAIHAALYPDETQYLSFSKAGGGGLQFSESDFPKIAGTTL